VTTPYPTQDAQKETLSGIGNTHGFGRYQNKALIHPRWPPMEAPEA